MPGEQHDSVPDIPVEVIRSARRRRTVSGRLEGDRIIVRVPARMNRRDEERAVREIVEGINRRTRTSARGDAELEERARMLNERHLDSRARPTSVRWVSNQQQRWGSCTPTTGEIRITDRLRKVPDYVLDAVLIHELAHTFVPGGHGPEFWEWAGRAPHLERARGYLEAYQRFGSPRP